MAKSIKKTGDKSSPKPEQVKKPDTKSKKTKEEDRMKMMMILK